MVTTLILLVLGAIFMVVGKLTADARALHGGALLLLGPTTIIAGGIMFVLGLARLLFS